MNKCQTISDTSQAVESLFELTSRLDGLKRCLLRCDGTNVEEFFELMNRLWCTVSAVKDPDLLAGFERTENYETLRDFFREKWSVYISVLEMMRSRDFLEEEGNHDASQPAPEIGSEDYAALDCELSLLDRQANGQRLRMIGCGPYPETLVSMFRRSTGIGEAIGIDYQREAIQLSRQVLAKLFPPHSDKHVRVVSANGMHYDYAEADIVVLANGLRQKAEILERILQTAPPHVTILARNPILMGRMLYEDIFQPALDRRLEVLAVAQTALHIKSVDCPSYAACMLHRRSETVGRAHVRTVCAKPVQPSTLSQTLLLKIRSLDQAAAQSCA